MNEEKSLEQRIVDTELLIKQVIGQSELNVSIIELIVRNLHSEIKMLAQQNLNNVIMKQREQEEQKEENTDGNTNEERQSS